MDIRLTRNLFFTYKGALFSCNFLCCTAFISHSIVQSIAYSVPLMRCALFLSHVVLPDQVISVLSPVFDSPSFSSYTLCSDSSCIVVQKGWSHPLNESFLQSPTCKIKDTQMCHLGWWESCLTSHLIVDGSVWCHPLSCWVLHVGMYQIMMDDDGYCVFMAHSTLPKLLTTLGMSLGMYSFSGNMGICLSSAVERCFPVCNNSEMLVMHEIPSVYNFDYAL